MQPQRARDVCSTTTTSGNMEYFDLDLLLSLAGGLGRWQERGHSNSSSRVYVKDADCLGEFVCVM